VTRQVIGIDPGRDGAISVVDADNPAYHYTIDMPNLTDDLTAWQGRDRIMADWWEATDALPRSISAIVVERIFAGPKASAGSLGTFLGEYWLLRWLVCHFAGLRTNKPHPTIYPVHPATWQPKILGKLKKGESKIKCEAWAKARWPDAAWPKSKAKRYGWCDSLALAQYGVDNILPNITPQPPQEAPR
jgi:hypothetical protein